MLAERFSDDKTDSKMEFMVLKNAVMAQKELDKTREKKAARGLIEEATTNLYDLEP